MTQTREVVTAMRALAMASIALTTAACVGGVPFIGNEETVAQDAETRPASFDPDVPDDVQLTELAQRRLAENECGLFLWSRTPEPQLVFYSRNDSGVAQVNIAGEEMNLPRYQTGGNRFAGQFTEQMFRSEDGRIDVALIVERGETLADDGGSSRPAVRVPNGTLRLSRTDGWETVVGVAGLVGCRPQA